MKISHSDSRLSWPGAISLETTSQYTRPWRIPFSERNLYAQNLQHMAATQAGVRLAFRSNTSFVHGRITEKRKQKIDLCLGGKFFTTGVMAEQDAFVFAGLPSGLKDFELWLPQRGDFALEHIEIEDDAELLPWQPSGPRWITYGSSITHCREASSPTRTWPAIVARTLGLDLTCLGFGGQCHLDTLVARIMRDRPADYLSVCAGVNIYGQSTLNARTFPSALIGFVKLLRERHPVTPLLIVSPIHGGHRESQGNLFGWTLQDYRDSATEAVEKLRESGDGNIYYLDGRALLDERLENLLLADKLHPSAEGYEKMADNFLTHASPILFAGKE